MNVAEFELISSLLKSRSGLMLSRDKAYLLESRLLPVARKWKLAGFEDLVRVIRENPDEALVRDIVESMTTNESFFFRDQKPFEQFQNLVLPTLLKTRAHTKTIRIWSAACSSGQEPYSLAMQLQELGRSLEGWKIEIVATVLSTEILKRAREGIYSQFEVQRGLPIKLLLKHFTQLGDRWQLSQKIRSMVTFRSFNLLNDPTALGRFDVVFCRNVLLYFDQETKAQVLERVAKLMPEDGFLYLGAAETVLGLTGKFQIISGQRGIYGVTPQAPLRAAVG